MGCYKFQPSLRYPIWHIVSIHILSKNDNKLYETVSNSKVSFQINFKSKKLTRKWIRTTKASISFVIIRTGRAHGDQCCEDSDNK